MSDVTLDLLDPLDPLADFMRLELDVLESRGLDALDFLKLCFFEADLDVDLDRSGALDVLDSRGLDVLGFLKLSFLKVDLDVDLDRSACLPLVFLLDLTRVIEDDLSSCIDVNSLPLCGTSSKMSML